MSAVANWWRNPGVRWWTAIVGAYFLTRLLLFWRFPVFWDEGFYAVQAQNSHDFSAARFSELLDGKGPLLNWISAAFVGFGATPLGAIRMVSLIAGISTLATTALIARRLAPAAGRVAAIVYVLSPLLLVHDVHGLVDPLLAALMSAALLLQLQQVEHARLDRAMALGLVMGTGLLTRDLGLIALLLLPLSIATFDFKSEGVWPRGLRWAGYSLISVTLAELCHSIVLLSPFSPGNNFSRSAGEVLKAPFAELGAIWPDVTAMAGGYLGWPLVVVAAAVVAVAVIRRQWAVVLVAVWAVAPWIAMIEFTPWGYPRYVVSGMGPFSVVVSLGLIAIWRDLPGVAKRLDALRSLPQRALTGLAAVVITAVVAIPVLLDGRVLIHPGTTGFPGEDNYQFAAGWPAGTGLDRIAEELKKRIGPGQTIVAAVYFTPWNLAALFEHPLRVPLPNSTLEPSRDGAVAKSDGRTIFFLPYGADHTTSPRFVLTQSVFPWPTGLDQARFRLVASYTRPAGAVVQGKPVAQTTVQLFEAI